MPSTRSNLRTSSQAEPRSARNRGTPKNNNNGGGITKRTTPKQNPPRVNPLTLKALCASLPGPFSELTQYRHIPVADIDAFVRRSAETRYAEFEDRPHRRRARIPRPMNPFILYRKCYVEQAKAFCKDQSTSNQAFSAVVGASWKMESAEVKARFERWARIEKEGHLEAHPGYRFRPALPPRQGLQQGEEDSDDEIVVAPVDPPPFALVQAPPHFTPPPVMGDLMPMPPADMEWQPQQRLLEGVQGLLAGVQGLLAGIQGSNVNPEWDLSFPMPHDQPAMPQNLLPMDTPLHQEQQETPVDMDMDVEALFALPGPAGATSAGENPIDPALSASMPADNISVGQYITSGPITQNKLQECLADLESFLGQDYFFSLPDF